MMCGSYWETEVYGIAPLAGLERVEMDHVFDWLGTVLPASGSKVDWSSVAGRHTHHNFVDDSELADSVAYEIIRRMDANSVVEHVGDSLSPFGVCIGAEGATAIVAALLEVPEHHYFVDRDRGWLVVVSSEGDLDVLDLLNASDG